MDESDREARYGRVYDFSPPANDSSRWRVDARQYLDECGLAGAVLTKQCVDLTAPDIKINSIECQGTGKLLDDTAQLEEGVHCAPHVKTQPPRFGDSVSCSRCPERRCFSYHQPRS